MNSSRINTMRLSMMLTLIVIGCLNMTAHAQSAEKTVALCPVMEEPVDPSLWFATDDGPVLVCCSKCVGKYQEDPQRYAAATAKMRAALAKMPKVQVTCPVSGETIDNEVSFDHNGDKIYFCCGKCKAKFTADPSKYKSKLVNSYSYQTRCPFSNDQIDPEAFVEFETGQKVYFCCGRCQSKYAGDPESHQDKLQAMNIYVNTKKLKKSD